MGASWHCGAAPGRMGPAFREALRTLLEDRKIAVATHNMFAYRRTKGDRIPFQLNHCKSRLQNHIMSSE